MTTTPKPMTLREQSEQLAADKTTSHLQWMLLVTEALDQLDEMAAACETALAVGEIHFKTCALSTGAHERLTAALARYKGRDG